MNFLGQCFKRPEPEQDRHTDMHRQTDATKRITTAAFAGVFGMPIVLRVKSTANPCIIVHTVYKGLQLRWSG